MRKAKTALAYARSCMAFLLIFFFYLKQAFASAVGIKSAGKRKDLGAFSMVCFYDNYYY